MIQDLFYRDHRKTTENKNEEAAMKRQSDRLVRDLLNAGLIECGMVWYESEKGFPYPYRYVQLTARGAKELEAAGLTTRFKSHRKDKGQDSARHALDINQFYVALQRACWQQGIIIRKWLDDRQLAALERADTLMENVPDAFFVLERDGQLYTHFLEADRGTEILVSDKGRTTDLRTKFLRYGTHLKDTFHQAPSFQGLPTPIVLIVTTGGPQRLSNMIDTAFSTGGRGSYWFTTAGELYASKDRSHFWAEHWQVPGNESYRSLLNRLK